MKTLKSARILAASLGVLAVGAMATPAMAFDNVDWTWNKKITQNEYINVYIDLDVDTTGLVEVEKLQIFLGNVDAQSTVSNIYNTQDQDGWYEYIRYCYCYVPVWVDPSEYAPTELPIVRSIATAVGNNQSITSDVPVYLHDGQFVANTWFNYDYDALRTAVDSRMGGGNGGPHHENGNFHTDLAVYFTLGAAFGLLQAADIHAYSNVYDILNASVESSATAVANNLSVNLESDVDGSCTSGCYGKSNHIVIADITQFAYANVSAVSNVNWVVADNYTGLRTITSPDGVAATPDPVVPLVSSIATAVGNNVSINVGKVDPTN
ncbi:MAG: hypothetical protein HOP13_06745 [Alphaproteobacteria bacterium]|nr:hypothetical protein [Alphaproteobacteria bacterium]